MFTLISKKVLNESTGEVEEVVLNEDELMDILEEAKKNPMKSYTDDELLAEGFKFSFEAD